MLLLHEFTPVTEGRAAALAERGRASGAFPFVAFRGLIDGSDRRGH
ncbi:MAG: hypothetical protein ACI8PZ_000067 [Myxococcota bacterium]|jgi:hypothetical protein